MKLCSVALLAALLAPAIYPQASNKISMESFGTMPGGEQARLYTLTNKNGMAIKITNYGGAITTIMVPDRHKHMDDVVLGFDDLHDYLTLAKTAYFGALIGRYANRIGKGTFTLDGKTYHIPVNDHGQMLHGGPDSFNTKLWEAKDVSGPEGEALELKYVSPNGQNNFPGMLTVAVRYMLPATENELRVQYTATTDKDTVINLANHSYFNLLGKGKGTILGHKVMIDANNYTPVNDTLIPTGVIAPVAGTPLDFRKSTAVGERINDNFEQLKLAKGYDFNYVLNHSGGGTPHLAARVEEPTTGRVLEVLTDQPGVQFYTGNFLDGHPFAYRSGLCFETQHFPDSPNHPNFPSTELKPGQTFRSTTIYRFSTK
ncbi:MAG TPA: aldose epimerase family protein [Bryobacteraceae bacterium]|jgi:aldose 1-epimerase|nr:aldose epimerase family protein [Bryobacteraceae bacterium]